jgi:hypothetical protein
MPANFTTAVLLHAVSWKAKTNRVKLGLGVYLQKTSAHNVGQLYALECSEHNLDLGDPYMYDACIIIYDWEAVATTMGFMKDPYAYINQIMNVIVITLGSVIDVVRIFISKDNFKTYKNTQEIDYAGAQSEFISENPCELNDVNIKTMKKLWTNIRPLWNKNKSRSRVINAFTHFFYCWNVQYIEQTSIYLSVVLENFFSPHSKDELSHQISFNVCQFLGGTKKEKMDIYSKVKKYYSVRSKTVHGEMVNDKDEAIIPEFFKTMCLMLNKILSDKKLIDVFDDNAKRKAFLEELIFK